MIEKKHMVIVGATSKIAECVARRWVRENIHLTLVARNEEKLAAIKNDLMVRNPNAEIVTLAGDLTDATAVKNIVHDILKTPSLDKILIAQGYLLMQEDAKNNLTLCEETIKINTISPMFFAEPFVDRMEKNNHGTLAIIGSVAGDRGRKSNYIYGATKGFIERYVQGLQHRLAKTKVKILLVKPGPTDTPMTAHYKEKGMSLASPEVVADTIVTAMEKGSAVVYAPKRWRYIMGVVKSLPATVFNRLDI